jgi:hypothetical protein
MSLRYGLNAHLYAIELRFRQQLDRGNHRGEKIYQRIALHDDAGASLVDLAPERGKISLPNHDGTRPASLIDPATQQIVVAAPVMFKGAANGIVVTQGDIGVLYRDLFIADAASNYREVLISADGRELPIASDSSFGSESLAKSLTGLPENKLTPSGELQGGDALGDRAIALRTRVPDSDLSLVTLGGADAGDGFGLHGTSAPTRRARNGRPVRRGAEPAPLCRAGQPAAGRLDRSLSHELQRRAEYP